MSDSTIVTLSSLQLCTVTGGADLNVTLTTSQLDKACEDGRANPPPGLSRHQGCLANVAQLGVDEGVRAEARQVAERLRSIWDK